MKKILMGTLGMAMAVSSFAGEYTGENTAHAPLTATVKLGDVVVTTGIKVTGDLNFGTLNPSLEKNGNLDSQADKRTLTVNKVTNGDETPLKLGEYGYKAISNNWSWDQALEGGYVNTDATVDEIYDVFHLNGEGPGVEIGDRKNTNFIYALKTQGKDGAIDVWFSGDVNKELEGNTYEARADIYVALPEVYEDKINK